MAVAGYADTVLSAHVQLHSSQGLYSWLAMAVDSACSNRLPSLKFVGDTLSVSALIGLVTLTFDLLTSNLVRVIAPEVGNLDILGTFRSRHMGQANTCQTDYVTLRP